MNLILLLLLLLNTPYAQLRVCSIIFRSINY